MEGPTKARGNNYGSRTWSRGTIGGAAVFGPARPLAARTTYGVTAPLDPTPRTVDTPLLD